MQDFCNSWRLLPLLLLLLLPLAASEDAEPTANNFNYIVMASKSLQLGANFTVGVGVTRATGGIRSVRAELFTVRKGDAFTNVTAAATRSAATAGFWTELQLFVNYESNLYDTNGDYRLKVSIVTASGKQFVNETSIDVRSPPTVTLIQTDKAVYQPGQIVQYRVVSLDSGLRPILLDSVVTIRDAQRNLVYKKTHNATKVAPQTADRVVSEGQMLLSSLPNEGSWTVKAKTSLGQAQKTILVENYVLPKFSLEVDTPSFVHFNDSGFEIVAKVRYTFGKPVRGTFNVTLGPYNTCRRCKDRYDQLEKFHVDAGTGEVPFRFDLRPWRQRIREMGVKVYSWSSFRVRADVTFEEKFTGVKKTVNKWLTIESRLYSVQVNTDQTPFFLPGFRVPVSVKLIRPDGQPLNRTTTDQLTVVMKYQRRGKEQLQQLHNGEMLRGVGGTGVSLVAHVPTDADFSVITFEASTIGSETSSSSSRIVPYMAVTDEFVTASFESNDDSGISMRLRKSEGINSVFLATLVRNQLNSWTQVGEMEGGEQRMDWLDGECKDCEDSLPSVKMVTLGVTATGEIVAASAEQDLSRFLNNLSLSTNLTGPARPQEFAAVEVKAKPNTFVFLTGIDHSVNLIRTGQDILRSSVQAAHQSSLRSSPWWPRPQSVTAGSILREHNLVLMSDGFYQDESASGPHPQMAAQSSRMRVNSAPGMRRKVSMDSEGASGGAGGDAGGEDEVQLRNFFPETMLWTMVKTDASGAAQQTLQLPDTITSWDISAFGVAARSPIQTMAAPMQVATLKKFFVRPILPTSIVRGEKFVLKVLSHKYGVDGSAVNVTLRLHDSFEASAMPGQNSWQSAGVVGVVIPSSSRDAIGAAAFELRAKELSAMPLTISGSVRAADGRRIIDVVEKNLTVVPEGRTVRKAKAMLISLGASDSDGDAAKMQTVAVDFPEAAGSGDSGVVAGSELLRFSVIGGVLGPAMENLDGLVRLPSGCGEQNLAKLAPAVSVARYLVAAKQRNSPILSKALNAMQTGYQRQLTYRRRDGSYSAFGDKDKAGSAWLTAFVLSVFARAAQFVTIDPQAVSGSSLKFLLERQQRNGSFSELPGAVVFDSSLQGGARSGSIASTAFICAGLIDLHEALAATPSLNSATGNKGDSAGLSDVVQKCLWHLKEAQAAGADRLSVMDVAVSTYAMQRASGVGGSSLWQSEEMAPALAALRRELASRAQRRSDGAKFWQTPTSYGGQRDSVEATAYALMVSAAADDQPDLEILRWLNDKQNDKGGFDTTQATVVGIRALTQFAEKVGLDASDALEAKVSVGIDANRQKFSINEENKWVLRSGILARGPAARVPRVAATAAGSGGLLLVSVAWQFNVRDPPARRLTERWLSDSGLGLRLGQQPPGVGGVSGDIGFSVCAFANGTEGMHILSVSTPSGYSPTEHSQPGQPPELKRVEPANQEVVFYFDSLSSPICVFAKWRREVPVLNPQPHAVKLQRYYNPERQLAAFYSSPGAAAASACAACRDCPGCDKAGEGSEDSEGTEAAEVKGSEAPEVEGTEEIEGTPAPVGTENSEAPDEDVEVDNDLSVV